MSRLMRRSGPMLLVVGLVSSACGLFGVRPSVDPTDQEIYGPVLAEVRRELDLSGPLDVHPLLARVDRISADSTMRMDYFNTYDTLVVTSVVEDRQEEFRLCELTSVRACRVGASGVYVIVSETQDLGEHQIGVIVLIVDQRTPTGVQRYYAARVQRGWFGWRVASLQRM